MPVVRRLLVRVEIISFRRPQAATRPPKPPTFNLRPEVLDVFVCTGERLLGGGEILKNKKAIHFWEKCS